MTFCLSWVFATANSVNQIFLPYLIKRVYMTIWVRWQSWSTCCRGSRAPPWPGRPRRGSCGWRDSPPGSPDSHKHQRSRQTILDSHQQGQDSRESNKIQLSLQNPSRLFKTLSGYRVWISIQAAAASSGDMSGPLKPLLGSLKPRMVSYLSSTGSLMSLCQGWSEASAPQIRGMNSLPGNKIWLYELAWTSHTLRHWSAGACVTSTVIFWRLFLMVRGHMPVIPPTESTFIYPASL